MADTAVRTKSIKREISLSYNGQDFVVTIATGIDGASLSFSNPAQALFIQFGSLADLESFVSALGPALRSAIISLNQG